MEFKALKLVNYLENLSQGYSAPSNIALVKYWGKYHQQIPANSSISFTLQNCKTKTFIEAQKHPKKTQDFDFEVYVDGKISQSFKPKISQFLKRVEPYFSFLKYYHFKIKTHNTFPHSSGIASSASGFAALASCFVGLEHTLANEKGSLNRDKVSFIARLGSGSASRSITGPMMIWGKHNNITQSSNEVALKHDDISDVFKTYQDVILLVDKGEKKVSSSVGHDLMKDHPFAQSRYEQAQNNLSNLLEVLKSKDLNKFIEITESEALSLHAMMMCSLPYYILMKPQTISIIERIWEYRRESSLPVSFTLDAGANVHVLFPKAHKIKVLEFINKNLIGYCQNEQYICDQVGNGISLLS